MGYYVAGIEILSEPCKRVLEKLMGSNEKILYCVASRQKKPGILERDRVYQATNGYRNWLDGLVFLDERVILIQGPKFGFAVLGNVEDSALSYVSIDYSKITSISVDAPAGGNIYFRINDAAMIMPKHSEYELRQLENWLRMAVRKKSQEVTVRPDASAPESKNVVQQLEKLIELHKSGSITDDEFAALKKKLLEG